MKITKNFTLEEMTRTSTGLVNRPNQEETDNIIQLCKRLLQPIRDEWGAIKVNSGFRSGKVNQAVGGVPLSDHRFGCAADISVVGGEPKDNKKLFDLILAMGKQGKLHWRQLIEEHNYKWIHISINNTHNRYKINEVLHIK